jgi:hypothetical protein
LSYCLRLQLKHLGYKKTPARIWASTLFTAGLLGSFAYYYDFQKVPLLINIADPNAHPQFRFSINTSGNPRDNIELTNDFLAYTNVGQFAPTLGVLCLPRAFGQNDMTINFLTRNASPVSVEDVQIAVALPKDLRSVPADGWYEYFMPHTELESKNQPIEIESWAFRFPLPMLPGDGQYSPPIKIFVPNSNSFEGLMIQAKCKVGPSNTVCCSLAFFLPFTNFANCVIDKPFVARSGPDGIQMPTNILYSNPLKH